MRAGCLVVAVLGVAAGSRQAAADEPRDGTTINGRFSIEETNDKFAIWKSTDSQFTQGLKLRGTWDPRWTGSWLTRHLYGPLRRLLKPNRLTTSIELGQDIFTPDDISPFREDDELAPGEPPLTLEQKQAEFDEWYRNEFPGDRPYSAELYAEWKVNLYFTRRPLLSYLFDCLPRAGIMRWSAALRGGYVGPTGAGQVQKAVHVLMRGLDGSHTPRDPQGWEFQQRENGFSPIRGTEVADKFGDNAALEMEGDAINVPYARVSGLATMELGQFRDLGGLGLHAEVGFLGPDPFHCFPAGAPQQAPPHCSNPDGPAVGGDVSALAFYLYLTGRGRFTVYNRHLDNRMFEDDVVEADHRLLDADFTFGAVARLWTFELEFSHTAAIKATGKHDLDDIDHHVGTFKLSALF